MMYYRIKALFVDRSVLYYNIAAFTMATAFERFVEDCECIDGIYYALVNGELKAIDYIGIDANPSPAHAFGKVYVDGTTMDIIIQDGWSRGLQVEQTYKEILHQGMPVSKDYIREIWNELDDDYFAYVNGPRLHTSSSSVDC